MRREAVDFANADALPQLNRSSRYFYSNPHLERALNDVQDYRRFDFDNDFPPRDISGYPSRIVAGDTFSAPRRRPAHRNIFKLLSPTIRFDNPSATVTCIRRQRRKEVIHALGVAGSKTAKPKWTSDSKVSCKRRK